MGSLNLTKVAVGCDTVDILREAMAAQASGGETFCTTRYRPTRHAELIGGSLYWIIKHRLVVRQGILGFAEGKNREGRPSCLIRLDSRLVPVRARPKRAHQGWRYLTEADAPRDLAGESDVGDMPPELISELSGLALI